MQFSDRQLDLLACPGCGGALDASLRCGAGCHSAFDMPDGIPRLVVNGSDGSGGGSSGHDRPTEEVRRFYTVAPFPNYRDGDDLSALRARAARSAFARQLDEAIPPDACVLDLGCGTGQMTLFLASGGDGGRLVVGADLTRASLALGAAAARRFGVGGGALFVETDLRRPGLRAGAFDVVFCSGVLHHTPDPRAAFASLVRLVRPGGILVVGLYSAIARIPHRLRRLCARLTGRRFFLGDPVLRDRRADPARRAAWLRDQYLHPLEHRHTLGEVQRWFRQHDVDFLRSFPSALLGQSATPPAPHDSLFSPAPDDWWLERALAQLAWTATLSHEGGLFAAIGRRRGGPAGGAGAAIPGGAQCG